MKNCIKSLFPFIPISLRQFLYTTYERFFAFVCITKEWIQNITSSSSNLKITLSAKTSKTNVLFYHPTILSFGGTEKSLQIIAKHLDPERYRVYMMYGSHSSSARKNYLADTTHITFIPFEYNERQSIYPFFLSHMRPSLMSVVESESIDVILTAGSGYTEYPINTISRTPIIMTNIFGSPSMQKNIVRHISVSHEVAARVEVVVPKEKSSVMYISTEEPQIVYKKMGSELRTALGLKENDMVFGRIGRPDDGIFDPIGIEAFKEVIKRYPHAHYIIQSPPPILRKKVADEHIPNIHFLEPTSDEEKIWSFHFAIDALAHFRNDGESCGLNIIESMIAGKPIISHRSHIWNAHTEYLEPAFSRIAPKDDYRTYAQFMIEFITLKKDGRLTTLGDKAREKGSMFLIKHNINQWQAWIDQSKTAIL